MADSSFECDMPKRRCSCVWCRGLTSVSALKKPVFAAAALLLSSSLSLAQVMGSDEQYYALFVTALDRCEAAYPDARAEYGRVRASLARLAERHPELAAAVRSPTLEATLAEARVEMDRFLAKADRNRVCQQLRQGRFGQME